MQAITIKRGKFGLGAFANATIAPNDYLGGMFNVVHLNYRSFHKSMQPTQNMLAESFTSIIPHTGPLFLIFLYDVELNCHFTSSLTASHRGLNYNFTLNSNLVIDAVACGNNTRYVNHGVKSTTQNCEARSLCSIDP